MTGGGFFGSAAAVYVGGRGTGRKLLALLVGVVVLVFRAAWWVVRHPAHAAAPVVGIACWVQTRSAAAAGTAAALTLLAVLAGWVALTWRLGSAAGVSAILVGLSRQQRLKRRWPYAAYAAGLTARGDPTAAPPLRRVRVTQTGVEAVAVTGDVGQEARALLAKSGQIAAACFCDRVTVKILSPSAAVIRWQWGRHLAQTYRLADIPPATTTGGAWPMRVAFGVTEDGGPAELVANLSVLVGGASGSGKSSLAWAYLGGYIAAGIPIRVRVIDPGQIEFAALRDRLRSQHPGITVEYVTDPKEMQRFWDRLGRDLDNRLRKVQGREHVPTEAEPLDITIVDELLPFAGELRKKGTDHVLGRVAFIGRKAAYVALVCSQAGQVDAIGRVRDLFPQRLCFRTPNPDVTNAILGGEAESNGARCSELSVDADRGVGYAALPETKGYVAFRSAYVPDAETKAIAAGRLPDPPTNTRLALETAPHVLYEYWARPDTPYTGQLLYTGIVCSKSDRDVDDRDDEHRRDDWAWYQYAAPVLVVEEYPNRSLALTAEALNIRQKLPLFNDQHNHDNENRIRLPRRRRRTAA